MIRGDQGVDLQEEYNMMLQLVRTHMMRRDQEVQPIVLQVHRDGAENGEQVTLVFGQSSGETAGENVSPPSGAQAPPFPRVPVMSELGPLLLQALALQILIGEQHRRVSAPLDEEAMGQLRRLTLNPEILERIDASGQSVCSICQESFVAQAEVYCLPCGHVFDVSCMQHWLERTRTCPNCRFTLQDVQQQYKDAELPMWWIPEAEGGVVRDPMGDCGPCPIHKLSSPVIREDEGLPGVSPPGPRVGTSGGGSQTGHVTYCHRERPQEEYGHPSVVQLPPLEETHQTSVNSDSGATANAETHAVEAVLSEGSFVDSVTNSHGSVFTLAPALNAVEQAVDSPCRGGTDSAPAETRLQFSTSNLNEARAEDEERENDFHRRGYRPSLLAGMTLPPPVPFSRSVSPPTSSTSVRISRYLAGECVTTRAPEMIPCPPARPGPATSGAPAPNARSRSNLLNPITPASGNARHAIRALRARLSEDGGSFAQPSEGRPNATHDAVTTTPARPLDSSMSRRSTRQQQPPSEDSVQRTRTVTPQQHTENDNTYLSTRREEMRQPVAPLQPNNRGNQRKSAQYHAIVSGHQRRS